MGEKPFHCVLDEQDEAGKQKSQQFDKMAQQPDDSLPQYFRQCCEQSLQRANDQQQGQLKQRQSAKLYVYLLSDGSEGAGMLQRR